MHLNQDQTQQWKLLTCRTCAYPALTCCCKYKQVFYGLICVWGAAHHSRCARAWIWMWEYAYGYMVYICTFCKGQIRLLRACSPFCHQLTFNSWMGDRRRGICTYGVGLGHEYSGMGTYTIGAPVDKQKLLVNFGEANLGGSGSTCT